MNTLLIVEDEKMIRQGIKAIVQRSPVQIDNIMECKNGEEALEIIRNQVVDVMLTDIRMPKMDGITLVKEMQKSEHVPLTVVISGYDDFSYAVELLRNGVREYILKPVEREQINSVLVKLEAELNEKMQKNNEILTIGYQQLKYLMLNKNISDEETGTIVRQFEHQFMEGEYLVCCSNFDMEDMAITPGVVQLNDVEHQDIFIIGRQKERELFYDEFRNYYVGVSMPHQGLGSLKAAYEEALRARKKAFMTGEYKVIYKEEDISYETVSDDMIEQIVQLIGASKLDEATKNIEHIMFKARKGKIDPDNFSASMKRLINKIASTYQNVISADDNELLKLQDIYSFDTAFGFYEALIDWMSKFHQQMVSEFEDYKNKQKIQMAIAFINDNYNKDLNMAVVSNHISMNYSLFSYVFKQYTGCNFVNYLKKIRISEAKRLLRETDIKIMEISQMVGYENEKHFMKLFKNACGVSPTEYRKNLQLGGSENV